MNETVAFIGLGIMGAPMARHLSAAGYTVQGYNRSIAKAQHWAQADKQIACATIEQCLNEVDAVITCVGNDDDLRQALLDTPAKLQSLKRSTVVIDHSTVSLEVTQQLAAACEEAELLFIDAPVSGGQQGAENGQLSIMVGGSELALAAAKPYLKPYAKTITHIGENGAGQLCKMTNQIAAAGVLQGLAEALHFAEQAQLDLNKVIAAISGGAAGSWQMSNRAQSMAEDRYDFGFAVDWMVKDLGITLKTASDLSADLNNTKSILSHYQELQEMGGGRWDTSSLFKRLQAKT